KGVGTLLPAGGKALLTTPFDWSSSATPMSAWLGGHSGRRVDQGRSESVMQRLFHAADAQEYFGLRLMNSGEAPPWHVRLHARSTMLYRNHRVILQSTKSLDSETNASDVEAPRDTGVTSAIIPIDTSHTSDGLALACATNAKVD